MPIPLTVAGLVVETQLTGLPVSPWIVLDGVKGISTSGGLSTEFTTITGKTDTVVQRIPGKLSPGTITLTLQVTKNIVSDMARWRNHITRKTTLNMRVNCGDVAPTAYWLQVNNLYLSEVTHPTINGSDMTFSLTFQLTE